MNEWINQDAFMITNGMVVGGIVFLTMFLFLFWSYMKLLGDYDALVEQKIKTVEHNYWKWITYNEPKQVRQGAEEERPARNDANDSVKAE
jgi:hypothetical protein